MKAVPDTPVATPARAPTVAPDAPAVAARVETAPLQPEVVGQSEVKVETASVEVGYIDRWNVIGIRSIIHLGQLVGMVGSSLLHWDSEKL